MQWLVQIDIILTSDDTLISLVDITVISSDTIVSSGDTKLVYGDTKNDNLNMVIQDGVKSRIQDGFTQKKKKIKTK